jgi:polar amino acid transport system substrate-binding protein
MKKLIAFVLAMVMALSLAACGSKSQDDTSKDGADSADGTKTVIMGIDAEYPPFSYMDSDGNYTGFDVEVCKAVCDLMGWEMKVFPVNWDQKLVQLDAGECDFVWSGMTILDSMKEAGYVISTPYYDNTQVIMVKEGSDIKSSADLSGKTVAVQLGTSGEALLAEGGDLADLAATFGNLTTCDSFLKCFTELGGGAVDAVIVDKPVAVSYAAENAGFTVLDEGLGAEQYGIAFRSGDAELCAEIEDAVAKLVENGTYAEIAAKYPDIVNNLTLLG